jgi:hypothetical protein
MQHRRFVVMALLGVAVLASCSDHKSAGPITPPAQSSTSSPGSTGSDATSSSTSPSSSIATSTTSTIAVTTTTIPTETLIRQAIQDYFTAYELCGQTPATCDPASFLATQGTGIGAATQFVADLVRTGDYFSTDLRGAYIVTESVEQVSATKAVSTDCWFDAGIVLGPNGSDGLPTVVNNQIKSDRFEHTLYLENGVWRVGEEVQADSLGEGNQCPAAA